MPPRPEVPCWPVSALIKMKYPPDVPWYRGKGGGPDLESGVLGQGRK